MFRDQRLVESSGREGILLEINSLVEHISRLFSNSLLNVVVSFNLRSESSVSGNGARFARSGGL